MDNEQILKKAIEKAVENGWNPIDDMGEIDNFKVISAEGNWVGIWINFETKHGDGGQLDIVRMLFTHSFPKAFWGEEIAKSKWLDNKKKTVNWKAWQYHLQQLVLCEKPLKYLEKFITQGSIR